ncbi:MAG: GNAT family N-acetyltransferase [Cyanobacteria bacterium REEB67]|nr:GNAT family N-acetyltransferase [Cyanobacteria bacterium REEB67]
MNTPFVSSSFEVPASLEADKFKLRMLTVNDVVKDFDAVMSSAAQLKGLFGGASPWPDGLTIEQNLIDLGWHQKEFQKRSSFAYTVMAPDESRCLGCVYIYPSSSSVFDAEVRLWARSSDYAGGLECELFQAVKQWIETEWPFSSVAFPGRDEMSGKRN